MIAVPAKSSTTSRASLVAKSSNLESRVAERKRELIIELIEHKKSVRPGAVEAGDALKERLADLARILKDNLTAGWDNLNDATRNRLVLWIER
jgi:hypothetical protein